MAKLPKIPKTIDWSKDLDWSKMSKRGINDYLFYAVDHYNLNLVLITVKAGANLKAKRDGSPILPYAVKCTNNRRSLINLLLDKGAEINAVDSNNQTALHLVAMKGNHRIIEDLIERGADLFSKNIFDLTPLGTAQRFNGTDQKTIDMLIQAENKAKSKIELGIFKTVVGIGQEKEIVLPHAKTL